MAWVQARSSDGENTGKRDNAQSNAAPPAVSGNHDLTRGRGRHFGRLGPRAIQTPRSESESSDPLTLDSSPAADGLGLLDWPRCTPYKCRQRSNERAR